jgi:hypothetical protein
MAGRVVFRVGVAGVVDLAAFVDLAVEVDDVVVGDVQPVFRVARPGLQIAQVLLRIGAGFIRLALVVQGDVGDRLAMRLRRVGRGAAPGGNGDDAFSTSARVWAALGVNAEANSSRDRARAGRKNIVMVSCAGRR